MYNAHLRWRYREFSLGAHVLILLLHSGHAGVQQHTVVKHFHHCYGAMQAANHPSLAYNSIFNIHEPWMGSFVCCPIATAKVLFPIDHCTLLDTNMSAV